MPTTINNDSSRTQGSRILSLLQGFQESDQDWSEDCAIVSRFYSGGIPETPEDQDTLGLVDHCNYSTGRTAIKQAKEETLAGFTKPHRLAPIKFREVPKDMTPTEKKSMEAKLTKTVDLMLRDWDPMFAHNFEKMVDRHVMHGDAVMMFPVEDEGWRPFSAKILTDPDAPQNPADDNFMRWAVYTDLQIGEALSGIAEDKEGWEPDAVKFIRSLWERKYDAIDKKDGIRASFISTFDDMFAMVEHVSPEEWAAQGHIGVNLCEFYNSRFRCFYYYQKDFSKPEDGIPVDLYIIARVQPRPTADNEWYDGDPLLYSKKEAYDDVQCAMVDFVLDTKLGVESPTWSTIGGLGHTNYNADRFTNLLLSSMVNSAIDKNTPLIEVADSTDIRQLEKFIKEGYKANSIIPAGASFVDKSMVGMQVGEAMEMIQYLQTIANSNAVGLTGRSPAPKDELRVDAISRQVQDNRTASNRGVQFADRMRKLVQEIVRRIAREVHFGGYFGRNEKIIERLKEELKRQKVDLSLFTEDNIVVNYSKLTGDGDPAARMARLNEVIARIGLVPSTARTDVLRAWFAEIMDDWEMADQVFESHEEQEPEQQEIAISKAADMVALGIPQVVTKDDVPEPQLQVLIPIMDGIVQRAVQQGQFTDDREVAGFVAIGQYAANLALVLDQRGQKDLADQFMKEIQRISTEAAGPFHNMQQAQQAQQDPRLEIEAGKLQLAAAKSERDERQFQHKQMKDVASQQVRNRREQFNEFAQTRRIINEEDRTKLQRLQLEQQRIQKEMDLLAEQSERFSDRP